MNVGDLISFRIRPKHPRTGEMGIIISIDPDEDSYTDSGCVKYTILTSRGDTYRSWLGDIERLDEASQSC